MESQLLGGETIAMTKVHADMTEMTATTCFSKRESVGIVGTLGNVRERNNMTPATRASVVQPQASQGRFNAAKRLRSSVRNVTETPQRTAVARKAVRQPNPRLLRKPRNKAHATRGRRALNVIMVLTHPYRSEERRVGKECRSR